MVLHACLASCDSSLTSLAARWPAGRKSRSQSSALFEARLVFVGWLGCHDCVLSGLMVANRARSLALPRESPWAHLAPPVQLVHQLAQCPWGGQLSQLANWMGDGLPIGQLAHIYAFRESGPIGIDLPLWLASMLCEPSERLGRCCAASEWLIVVSRHQLQLGTR